MTVPHPPRTDPLQDDELDLQRVLRALPPAEPSARVDAAILAAATDAAGPVRARGLPGLRWLPTWAIGTAAAAVLAVGVGMQLRPALAPEAGAPAAESQAAPAMPPARERLSVELVEPERELAPMPGPPPETPVPRAAVAAAPPPPPAPAPVTANQAPEPEAFPAPLPLGEATASADEAMVDALVPAAAPAAAGPETLDSITVTGSRISVEAERAEAIRQQRARAAERAQSAGAAESAQAAALAQKAESPERTPVALDAQLEPREWLERIRERRKEGDTAGARASLQLFVQTYPDAPLPSDLARLR